MTISIPDTLTSDNSEKYIMSIRLRSGGLSFSGHVPSVGGSFFYREVDFDRTVSFLSALKEFFFTHEFLTWSYKRVNVVSAFPQFTLIPQEYFDESKMGKMLDFVMPTSGVHVLHDTLDEMKSELVFGVDEDVYEFCSRSLLHPYFTHYMTPLLVEWKERSSSSLFKQMYVIVDQKRLDVVCCAKGVVLFHNGFKIDQVNDILYYILGVWKHQGFDQQQDQLFLVGNSSLNIKVKDLLKVYLRHIGAYPIPSEAYLLGEEVVNAPMDLISLLKYANN